MMTSLRLFRLDLLSPKEIPIIFNRKTRKVYRVVPEVPALQGIGPVSVLRHWASTFRPWPIEIVEYDWDCLEAEFFKETTLAGNVVKSYHHLQMYVKAAPDSDEVLGTFSLASPMVVGEVSARRLWEHIRRFMEEGGPALSPGDEPALAHPRNPIAALNTVLPYGWPLAVLGLWWGGTPFVENGLFRMSPMAFLSSAGSKVSITAFGVAMISFFVCSAAFFNWIAHLIGPELKLPEDLLRDAGTPVDLKQLAKAQAGR